jgi:putative ABC transport system substrate-binding protein
MTNRRQFLLASATAGLASRAALAQQHPVRIGILGPRSVTESSYTPHLVQRLQELGYRDGSTALLEVRSAEGVVDVYPKLAKQLFERKCDLIFAVGSTPARALRDARSPVPVVFLAVEQDPLKAGIVSDLRRPDGNRTGVYVPQEAMVAKRIELLRELLPLRRLLVLGDPTSKYLVDVARRAAQAAGVQATIVEFSRLPYDFEGALANARKAKAEAVMLLDSPRFSIDGPAIAALFLKHHLPSVGSSMRNAEVGMLLSFSANQTKAARRTAELGVQVLKGAKPADIPVEQADEFELVINAKTAKALGIRLPESIMARATRIVS